MDISKRNSDVSMEDRLEHLAQIRHDMHRFLLATRQLQVEFDECTAKNAELIKTIPREAVATHPEYMERAAQIAQISFNMISNYDTLRKLWIDQYFYLFTCAHGRVEENAILAEMANIPETVKA